MTFFTRMRRRPAEAMDAEAMDAEAMDAEAMDTEAMDTEAMDTEAMGVQVMRKVQMVNIPWEAVTTRHAAIIAHTSAGMAEVVQ